MSKKISKIIGLVVSVILIIVGIAICKGELTGDNYYTEPANYLYDYGYATFGADFYTFVSNNAALAAYNTVKAVAQISNMITLMENVFGWAFIATGMFGICKFGKKDEDAVKNNTIESPTENPEDKTESIAEEPAEESVNEENSCGE